MILHDPSIPAHTPHLPTPLALVEMDLIRLHLGQRQAAQTQLGLHFSMNFLSMRHLQRLQRFARQQDGLSLVNQLRWIITETIGDHPRRA